MKLLGENPIISKESVQTLTIPVRLARGWRDSRVTKEETLKIKEGLQFGQSFEIPNMIHPLGFISPKNSARLISIQLQSLAYQWASTPFGKMAYQVIGEIKSETETVVLFLHEEIGSIAQRQNFPKHLCKELKLAGIAIEFPGYEFSDTEEKERDAN
jgi:hypothetical protein